MPETPKKFYLTTPIYYVNARPHIGHAYSTIAADVIARRHRLLGDDTFFLTGTDEHGQKVQRSAEKAGVPPQQFADEVSATFQNLWKRMGITNDDYIRTTDERHKRGVQKLWSDLEARGAIYLSTYTGQYSVGEEMFVEGPPGTIGPDGKPTETVTEENYFFKLSEYQERLINLIESGELQFQPETAKNEILSFLRGPVIDAEGDKMSIARKSTAETVAHYQAANVPGSERRYSYLGNPYIPGALRDLSISRTTFDWGIPVPGNPKHVIYVWLDALANYMTAVGYGSDDPADIAKFEHYWPADLHLVGKEITRQHCIYWPAFLMAAGIALPKSVVANGWLLFHESKMSKSAGNVVRTETILDAFGDEVYGKQFPESTKNERDLFAADVLRYFLLREIPFGQDGSFSFDALITRYNADLANGYGNLVSRTLSMIDKYFAGNISQKRSLVQYRDPNSNTPIEVMSFEATGLPTVKLMTEVKETTGPQYWLRSIDFEEDVTSGYNFASSLGFIAEHVTHVDAYITAQAPWKLASSDANKTKLNEVLYTAAESIRIITALLYPVLPYATASVWRQLGLGSIEEAARNGELKNLQWGGLKPGTKLGALAPIFPRADKGLAQIMTDMENPTTPAPPAPTTDPAAPTAEALNAVSPATEQPPATGVAPAVSPTISIDDFIKIDLRVAQIVVAERIPKADKLLRLEVDLGYEKRQILSGIAEFYTPEELIGKRIAIIANLAPRKMRGLESHGMLLAASGEDHSSKPILATFSDEIALGSKIR
jgi:methionyl-tRNA synthetase